MLIAEVVLYVAAMATFLMLALPVKQVRWYVIAFGIFAAAFPIAMNLLHGDRPADSGLRVDNLAASAKLTAPSLVVMVAMVVIAGFILSSWHWMSWKHFGERSAMYLAWGPAQQYLLQAFALRRLRQAGLNPVTAVIFAAVIFALMHMPNWPLVGLTFAGGLLWCSLFLRKPNIIILGLAHGILAVLIFYALPEDWLERLTVGGEYLRKINK